MELLESLNTLKDQLTQKEEEKKKIQEELLEKLKSSIKDKEEELKELKNTLASFEKSAVRTRKNNEKVLHEVLHEVLEEASEPLSAKELESLVIEAGYETNSNKFTGMVLHCLTLHPDKFKRVTEGTKRPAKFVLNSEEEPKE